VVGVAVIGHWVFVQLTFVCVCVFVCVEWVLRSLWASEVADLKEQYVHQVLLNSEKPASYTFEMLKKALVMMP
jgi:hypothetical protein